MIPSAEADVVVVGGGLAGLYAARLIKREGLTVKVVEARDRVGGRTWTQNIGHARFGVGGQWIGPGQHRLSALVDSLGIETFPTFTDGAKILEVDGKISTYKSKIPSLSIINLIQMQGALSYLERIRKRVSPDAPLAGPRAVELDAETVETLRSKFVKSDAVRGVMDAAVRTVFGCEASELSALYFLMYLNAGGGLLRLCEVEDGAQQDRFIAGAGSISEALAAELEGDVMLSLPARQITQGPNGVEVTGDSKMVAAQYAIVATPPALAGRIRYEPLLSAARDQLTQRFCMGATVKFIATYKRSFWRDAGFSGELVSSDGPISTMFDNTSHDGTQPALVGFIVGNHARRWSEQPRTDRQRRVVSALVRYFGEEAADIDEYHELDWSMEEWSRGCPVGVLGPGAITTSFPQLRKPEGRIHFAGTETATEWIGYMEGALQSGERAADEVIRRILSERPSVI